MWAIIITGIFSCEHSVKRLINSREDTLAMLRFLKAENARGCLFGIGVTAKVIRCRPAYGATTSEVRDGPTLV